MTKSCPSFVCLVADEERCNKYPACTGCDKLYACHFCANQSTLIDGNSLPCDMINLPSACRACPKRSSNDFSPSESCHSCPHQPQKVAEASSANNPTTDEHIFVFWGDKQRFKVQKHPLRYKTTLKTENAYKGKNKAQSVQQ